MRFDDVDIGNALIPGQRLKLEETMSVMLDAKSGYEIIALRVGEAPAPDIMSADPQAGYAIERDGSATRLDFVLERLDSNAKILVAVYATTGLLPDILATVSNPRFHLPVRPDGAAGALLFEIYNHRGEWRLKVDGSPYKEGLPALLSSHSKRN